MTKITDLDTGATLDVPASSVRIHDDNPMGGERRYSAATLRAGARAIDLDTLADVIRATQMRILATASNNPLGDELRGVRRTAAHIADNLPLTKRQAFLTACGYGA